MVDFDDGFDVFRMVILLLKRRTRRETDTRPLISAEPEHGTGFHSFPGEGQPEKGGFHGRQSQRIRGRGHCQMDPGSV